jgi:hypothetical protein
MKFSCHALSYLVSALMMAVTTTLVLLSPTMTSAAPIAHIKLWNGTQYSYNG